MAPELILLQGMSLSPRLALSLTASVLLTACGLEASQTVAPAREASALEGHFVAAAREYQVPVGLLKAIAYVETRVSMVDGVEGGGGYGVMHLTDRADWNMLARAAALTGATQGKLKVDPAANVRGAAAVLRELFDKVARDDTSLSAHEAGDWYRAVALYPGFDQAGLAADWAADVYARLEAGFIVDTRTGRVSLTPTPSTWRRFAPQSTARRDALGDYPGIAAYVQSPNYSSGRTSYEFVVVHTMQGSYAGARSWFLNTSAQVSSQYILRSSDGQITQMVADGDTAWHAQCYNRRSIGLEHEGYVQDPGLWYTDAMYTASANLTRWLADRHGIPKNRTHIIGHNEVAPSCNTGGHTDPGTGWNWQRYMGLILNQTPGPSTGVLIGAIYEGGNTANRVAGAVVTVNGASVTTAADGLYQFTLPVGSYTASVAKSGYGSATVTRAVVAGTQTWGSMEVNPVAQAAGTLRGKVFIYDAANPSDMTRAIAGATVRCSAQTATSDATGMWSFSLPPGAYTVTVSAPGYEDNQVTRTVAAAVTVWGSVGLTTQSSPDTQPPVVAIVAPVDGSSLDLAVVQLKGTASDNAGALTTVKVSLNGGAQTDVVVTNGQFSLDVQLEPGTNALTVKATDAAGNTATASATASFNAGVGGFVHVQGDEGARVSGAAVQLLESGSATPVSTAVTDASGAFSLPVMNVPADYVLVVRAQGFVSVSETVTAPEDRRLSMKVGLVAGQDGAAEQVLVFAEPLEGAVITTDTVTVYGTVRGFDVLGVKVNGVQAELLGAGGFTATVPLVEGANTLEALATGVLGETVLGRIQVTRKAASSVGPNDGLAPVRGGCAAVPGLDVAATLALAAMLRRRARLP